MWSVLVLLACTVPFLTETSTKKDKFTAKQTDKHRNKCENVLRMKKDLAHCFGVT